MANAGVRGRPIAPLVPSPQERAYLERQIRRHRVARSLSERCRAILRCADGLPNKSVAAELGIHDHTVGKWRRRFLKDRCDGLLDEARPGRPRTISDNQVAALIERTLQATPGDATHWSSRSMAAETGFSYTTPRSAECGRRSACSRTVARHSSCRAIRCLSTSCAISSAFTYPHRTELSSSASMRKARFRLSIASSRSCR
ncbi:transposase [Bradyrhizobium elkanii]|uniref:Transposase n=1 Tax=Bradyrhizobium elkanii TaxID=29448 RepID=A0ABV4EQW9_BRAEL